MVSLYHFLADAGVETIATQLRAAIANCEPFS
jgi:hypothetical protein